MNNCKRRLKTPLRRFPLLGPIRRQRVGKTGAKLRLRSGQLALARHYLEHCLRFFLAENDYAIDLAYLNIGNGSFGGRL